MPRLPLLFGAFTAVLGAGVLVSWLVGHDMLTRVFPGMITMKPNTALAFLLAGLAICSIRDGRGVSRRAVGLSLAVAALGGLTCFEYVGFNLGIDELIAREPAFSFASMASGRMHPATAFNFLLLGLASALLAFDREHRAAQGLILVTTLIAASTLIGYLYGVRNFVGLAVYNQMALHTSLGMLALSAGLLLSRPNKGLMVSLSGDGPSNLMARWLLPVAIMTPIVATGLTILAREAGWFDERYGAAVRVTVVVAVFVGCIWRSAHSLHRIDAERRRADSERIEVERRFRFLAESMPQIVWVSSPAGEPEYINRRWFDYTGQDPAQAAEWQPILHPDDTPRCLELWDKASRSGENYQGEFRFLRHDGTYRWHLARAEALRDESGAIIQWVGTSTDINDQKRAGEQRYRSVVEATAAIVWHTPASGIFESDQPGWRAFTGQSLEQLKGWGWIEAIHPADRAKTAQAWDAALLGRGTYEVEHRLKRHDGEFRHMIGRAVPLLDDDGKVREWFGVHTDVDDQVRAHEAMRAAKETAEAATVAKAEFLANMSHEIRTPMNGVLGMTELALGTDLTSRQREYLLLVKSSADSLLTVIDDILDFSKIEAGKLHLEPIPFQPRDVVTDTLRCLALKAHEKGLELACRIAPEIPDSLVGDPGRLRQVLVNLVGNAIKFTDRGEVVVTVDFDPDDESHETLRYSVADTGIGIPAEKRASIFDAFEQADNSTTRRYGGTGLGLTICSRLIGLMGGRVWVEENPGRGSIFRFTTRFDRETMGLATRPLPDAIVLDGLRILIVDDNQTNRMILEEILSQWGCRPVAVPGASEALAVMAQSIDRGDPFPLILLDRMMPDTDGCMLARQLRADPRNASVKLMMLTSGGADESDRSPELGIGAWLVKPVRQSELLVAILDLIGTDGEPARPVVLEPVEPVRPSSARRLRVLLAEDHPINQKVAVRMLQDQGHEVTVAANGRLALEALASATFDVVLMDVQMPEIDGFEALAAIRRREQVEGGHLPVFALTAHAMAGVRERCLEAGFDEYLTKPIRAASLAKVLAMISLDDPEPSHPAPPTAGDRRVFDHAAALKALEGDESLLVEILEFYLDDTPRLLAEVRLAIENGQAEPLGRLGHTLAGSASHFFAEGVAAAARELEAMGKAGDLAEADHAVRNFVLEFDRFRQVATEVLRSNPLAI